MQRRDFMKVAGLSLASQAIPPIQGEETIEKPNLIFIVADQRHYGLSKARRLSPSIQAPRSTGCSGAALAFSITIAPSRPVSPAGFPC